MQIVRNIQTGHEFAVTKELIRFAEDPRNNLEVVEVEDLPLPDQVDGVKTPEVLETKDLPLADQIDDGFVTAPSKKK